MSMRVVVCLVGLCLFGTVTLQLSAAPPEKLTPIHVGIFPQELSTAYSTDDGLPSDDIYAVALTDSGDVYAGTAKGLVRFDGMRWQSVTGIPQTSVRCLAADAPFLYVATDTALFRLKGGNAVEQICELPAQPTALNVGADSVWIGTSQGLFQLRQNKLVADTTLNPLLRKPAGHTTNRCRRRRRSRCGCGSGTVSATARQMATLVTAIGGQQLGRERHTRGHGRQKRPVVVCQPSRSWTT